MTKVFLFSNEEFLAGLKSNLERTGELEFCSEPDSAELILVYASSWNRKSFAKIRPALQKRAIIFCEYAEQPFSRDSLYRGEVSGVISARAAPEQLIAAVDSAKSGLIVQQPVGAKITDQPDPALTPRELEILRLIADGESNKSIASLLEISEHTVKFHIASIFEKIHAFNRTEAVRAGITLGLISI